MKKRRHLLIFAVILVILAACGADQAHGESVKQAGIEVSEDGAGAEGQTLGIEVPGDEAGIAGSALGIEEPGDEAGVEGAASGTGASGGEAGADGQASGTGVPGDEAGADGQASGTEVPGVGTGADGTASGIEAPRDEEETKEPNLETAGNGEDVVFLERVYETDIIYYNEPSDGLHLRKDVEKTQTDYAVYYFELSINEQERNACIAATDRMLSCIDAVLPDLEVVVLTQKSYDGVSISGNRLYLSPQPWNSVDYLAKVLLAGYGEWGNYGLAYGYADYLCEKAGLDGGKTNSDRQEAGSFVPMGASEGYDLNLLCFDERFLSQEDVEAAKNNARLFVDEYLSAHSEEEFLELLSASGTSEGVAWANEALETFYAENGVECSLTRIRYQYGGVTSDYGAACDYACFYIYRDWQDVTWEYNPMVSENFLHEDYGEVRDFFECNVRQMQQYQEFFGFDSYNNDLLVLLRNYNVSTSPSYYIGRKHTICLENVSSLMHEYIHSVTFGRVDWDSKWKTEGFAAYYCYKYNLYMYDYLNEDWNRSRSIIWVQEYIDTIGRPIDVRTDFREINDIGIRAKRRTDPNDSYWAGASFIGYLVEQYGEQAAISYVCSDDEYNAEWDKSYGELVRDWRKYINEKYSQYSREAEQ